MDLHDQATQQWDRHSWRVEVMMMMVTTMMNNKDNNDDADDDDKGDWKYKSARTDVFNSKANMSSKQAFQTIAKGGCKL